MRGARLEEHGGDVELPLAGRDVQRGVAIGGGGVGVGHVLQQQLHNLRLAQARGDVQWGLFFLQLKSSGLLVLRSHPRHSILPDLPTHLSCRVTARDNRRNGVMEERKEVSDSFHHGFKRKITPLSAEHLPWLGHQPGPRSSGGSEPLPPARHVLPCAMLFLHAAGKQKHFSVLNFHQERSLPVSVPPMTTGAETHPFCQLGLWLLPQGGV